MTFFCVLTDGTLFSELRRIVNAVNNTQKTGDSFYCVLSTTVCRKRLSKSMEKDKLSTSCNSVQVHKLRIRTYNSILMLWLLNFEALTSGVGGSLTVSLLILAALKLILCVIQL